MVAPAEAAQELLGACIRGEPWRAELLRGLVDCALDDPEASRALFGILVEGLSDLFEPRLTDAYAAVFSEVIACALPQFTAGELLARYQRVRQPRRFRGEAGRIQNVFVLSRVTLGADIAVTSLVLDAAKRRFPEAQVFLAGGKKNWELFAGDLKIRHLPVAYGRGGTLRERLAVGPRLAAESAQAGSLVIDPDSRLTQLGLLPVSSEEGYFFFESRSYGGEGDASLTELIRRWLRDTFGIPDARPYIAPAERVDLGADPVIAVSLGVGDNPAKRIPGPFEEQLLRALARRRAVVLVDTGPGGEEAERVKAAIAHSGAKNVRTWEGSFAAFASMMAQSRLYVGYDSAGQHAAAACGVPLVTVFAGFPSPRMLARWRPTGPGPIEVVRVDDPDPARVLAETLEAIDRLVG
jgi:ADP-heptose:LPS heptosyltransferase